MRRTELVSAAVLVAAGLVTIAFLIPRYVVDPGGGAVSPRILPYVAAALATAAAVRLLIAALARRGADGAAPAPFTPSSLRFLAATAVVLGGSYLLMDRLGYLVGGAALVAGMLLVARAKLATVVAAAILAPALLWLVFARLLATPLP